MKKKSIITIISCLFAVIFTIYIALDTFVIEHVYEVVDTGYTADISDDTREEEPTVRAVEVSDDKDQETADYSDTADIAAKETDDTEKTEQSPVVVTEDGIESYSDENITITITTTRVCESDVYIADIVLSSAEYLKTAFAKQAYGKNVTDTTSSMASENNAILAINGDYYGTQESGYVIRNGKLYRSTQKGDQEDLVIYSDGSMEIINENDITAEELLEKGAMNVLSFGPGLVKDGEIIVTEDDEVAKARSSNPRTAIGIIDELHYVFVVADGRTDYSDGLTLFELAEYMKSLGVKTAYNLDGGGSSTMVFNGTLINNPTSRESKRSSSGTERRVSDIVYIGY